MIKENCGLENMAFTQDHSGVLVYWCTLGCTRVALFKLGKEENEG